MKSLKCFKSVGSTRRRNPSWVAACCVILCIFMVHLVTFTGIAQRTRPKRTQPDRKPPAANPRARERSAEPAIPNAEQPQFRVQVGHTLPINTLALSANGTRLLSGSEDHSLILWDVASGTMLRQYTTYVSGSIKSAAFSPDGTKLIVMSQLFVRVIDVATGKDLHLYTGANDFSGMPMSVAVSNDGRLLLVGDNFGQSGHIFSLVTGRKVREYKKAGAFLFPLAWQSAAFSPDGTRFIVGGCPAIPGYSCEATVWDTVRRRALHSFSIDTAKGQFLFTKDGAAVFVASEGHLLLRSASTGRTISSFEGLIGDIGTKSLSDDGKKVWTVADDGSSAALWEVSTGQSLEQHFSPGANAVVKSVFYQDGRSFAITTDETGRHISIWDVQRKQPKVEFRRYGYRVTASAFSPDGSKALLADSSHSAVLWDLLSGKPELRLRGHRGVINAVAFSADGSKIVTGGDDHSTILWDAATGSALKVLDEPDSVAAVAFTKDGSRIVSVSVDPFFSYPKTSLVLTDVSQVQAISLKAAMGRLNVNFTTWDVSSFRMVNRWKKPLDIQGNFALPVFAISPGADSIAFSEFEDTVVLYDAQTGRVKRRLKDDGAYVDAISFSQNGKQILVDNQGGNVNQLALDLPRILQGQLNTNTDFFGKRVITLWDVEGDGKATARGEFMSEAYRFAPGGDYIYSTVANNITQWEYPGFKVRHVFNGHTALVRSISAFSPGELVLTTSDDGTARIWREDGAELCRLISLDRNWVVVRPDGRFDTGSFDDIKSLQWVLPDAPNDPLSLEIFMRDYYEPQLLSRLLQKEEFPKLPSVADLNRNQPRIDKITILPRAEDPKLVDVKVQVASVDGCPIGEIGARCESGVFDLRLYRDGHLVGQSPAIEVPAFSLMAGAWREKLQQWRSLSEVRDEHGNSIRAATGPREISFNGIRLPTGADITRVLFTAYAFNADRVKSATSKPEPYKIESLPAKTKRRAFIITVGVDATSTDKIRLAFAPNGARDVAAILTNRLSPDYNVVPPVQLISEYEAGTGELLQDLATKENIKAALSILSGHGTDAQKLAFPALDTATPDDLVVLYVASHGYADPYGRFYAIPSDIGDATDVSEKRLNACVKNLGRPEECAVALDFLSRAISSDELTRWMEAVDAGQMVLILDSCHSGAVPGPNFKPGPMGDAGFGQLSYDKRMLVLAATQAENVAWGAPALGNRSLLTRALTERPAEPRLFDLRQWLRGTVKYVPELYRQIGMPGQRQQEPFLFDFSKERLAETDFLGTSNGKTPAKMDQR